MWKKEGDRKGESDEEMWGDAGAGDALWLTLKMEKGVTGPKMVDIFLKVQGSKRVEMDPLLPRDQLDF